MSTISPLIRTDSYKSSHYLQYPKGTTKLFATLEARTGAHYAKTMFFGLQHALVYNFGHRNDGEDYPVTLADVEHAAKFWKAHGEPFPADGWRHIVNTYHGHLPVRIRAVPEGTMVPMGHPLMTVESTDPKVPWITTWVETRLMRYLWYPCTVATRSFYCKKAILGYLEKTAMDPAGQIGFKLHDFGGRGCSSDETAEVGGMAHLVNFFGTDTAEAIMRANASYNPHWLETGEEEMYGFSIPAMEHSTVTSWGRDGEAQAFLNFLTEAKHQGFKMAACVSDSYDLMACVKNIWGVKLQPWVKESGMTVVIRPDSGDAAKVNVDILKALYEVIPGEFTKNDKGYLVLPSYYRVIQGDGNDNEEDVARVLHAVTEAGFSAENMAFGMGGGLLQKLDRDTQRFAYKVSAREEGGKWHDVCKDPLTDPTKRSKAGVQRLLRNAKGAFVTVDQNDRVLQGTVIHGLDSYQDAMEDVYENGYLKRAVTFSDVRAVAAKEVSRG